MTKEITMQEEIAPKININPNLLANNSLLNLIDRLAQNPVVDVAKMMALLDVQERIMNKNAEMAFNQAFSKMSTELPRIVKKHEVEYENKKTNKTEKAYNYATIEDIDEVTRPLLQKYGFTFSVETSVNEKGGMIVTGSLSHEGGYTKKTSMPLALDTSGGKNNLQGAGSTITYGTRYALTTLLNIILVDEDNDGEIPEAFINEEKFNEIMQLIEDSNTDTQKFCEHLKINALRDMPNSMFEKAKGDLKGKIAKMGAK